MLNNLRLLVLALYFGLAAVAQAQPQWRFHLAFEDGSGARDTIWFVYDTAATVGSPFNPQVDEDLGEGAVEMDLEAFNVWVPNWQWDSTKTMAWPYTQFPLGHMVILAFNYTAPVIIRWDPSLFSSPVLPITPQEYIGYAELLHDYFWLNGLVTDWGFGMLNADSVVVEDPAFVFGMMMGELIFTFQQHSGMGISEQGDGRSLRIWPNPSTDAVFISAPDPISHVEFVDASGRLACTARPIDPRAPLDVHRLPIGMYTIRAYTSNTIHHGRFIKVDSAW